tara:strand:+ start:116 stop:295 length:180 start_codon:yes stop_codon:yes gene_type:complete
MQIRKTLWFKEMEAKYKSYNREIEFFFDGFNGIFLVCEKGKSDLDKEQFSKVTFYHNKW